MAKWARNFLKVAMLLGSAALFVTTAVAAFDSSTGAWPLCVGAIALLVLAHFDQIAEISASATGAKIVLQQVKDRVTDLQRLVKLSARMNLALGQRVGRWGKTFTEDEKDAIRTESKELLREAGVPDDEIKKIMQVEWDRYVRLDYIFWIAKGVTVGSARAEWDAIIQLANPGAPAAVEAFLAKAGELNDKRRKLLDLYRHFYEYGEHRDRLAWAHRDDNDE